MTKQEIRELKLWLSTGMLENLAGEKALELIAVIEAQSKAIDLLVHHKTKKGGDSVKRKAQEILIALVIGFPVIWEVFTKWVIGPRPGA